MNIYLLCLVGIIGIIFVHMFFAYCIKTSIEEEGTPYNIITAFGVFGILVTDLTILALIL